MVDTAVNTAGVHDLDPVSENIEGMLTGKGRSLGKISRGKTEKTLDNAA